MTASLPPVIQDVFARFITTEYTTVDASEQPIAWPVTPYYRPGGPTIDITTGLGYPKKANDARANPKVALLFSDPTGCGVPDPPMVLVQGTAEVNDHDLVANRERYAHESAVKLPGAQSLQPPAPMRRFFSWYYTRIYVHVRPERIYVWPQADIAVEPLLYGSHMEEVRSGHSEEADLPHAEPEGGAATWDARVAELGSRYTSAALAFVAPDGFPFTVRVAVRADPANRRVRIAALPTGTPIVAGPGCLTAHDHAPDFRWQRNFQIRGDLQQDDQGWWLSPHRLVGGFEMPPTSTLARYRLNLRKTLRFRSTASRELARMRAERSMR
ncbi:MAG TPA: pyridoxamine 5'-phosphate oxidase family protein [Solirubrobacteraceae bacterium]|nr:pyridoxamine 5'-phosphate oxidase family protein [Solirubrobacteraceae bacterium]